MWLLALFIVLLSFWQSIRIVAAVRQAQHDVDATMLAIGALRANPGDRTTLARLAPTLAASESSLRVLQRDAQPVLALLPLARPLPPRWAWLADLPDALDLAVPLASLGATALEPLSAALVEDLPGQARAARTLAALAELAPRRAALAADIDAAEQALADLEGRTLGGPLSPLQTAIGPLTHYLPVARQTLPLLDVIGPALGMQGPRSYLLLGQNRDELRATGGFIGTLGSLEFEQGQLVRFDYGSSYLADADVAPLQPPAPLARHLGLGGWYLRDANWWPDFPATAAQAEQAWARAGQQPIDGVIAIDTSVVQALLQELGPLDVPGYEPVDADNFEAVSVRELYTPRYSGAGFHHVTEAFFGAFGRAFRERLLALSPGELVPLGKSLISLLETKHIQIAFKDPQLIEFAHGRGWDGAFATQQGDSLYVVDTTVSYGKTYKFVRTAATLDIALDRDGRARHELNLRYENSYPEGLLPWMPPAMVGGEHFDALTGLMVEAPGFWGNWLRIYLPPDATGAVVEGLEEQPPPQSEFGRLLVAGYLPLPPGTERLVRVRYVTDAKQQLSALQYRLFLGKQAGLDCRPIRLSVQWPNGTSGASDTCPLTDGWVDLPVGSR